MFKICSSWIQCSIVGLARRSRNIIGRRAVNAFGHISGFNHPEDSSRKIGRNTMSTTTATTDELVAGSKDDKSNGKQVKSQIKDLQEGKVTIRCNPAKNIFYNPAQEVNRDVSILGIQTFLEKEGGDGRDKLNILEAMAASGIRSIRYAKEIQGVDHILANDFSPAAIECLKENIGLNHVENVRTSCEDASLIMLRERNSFTVVDLDPYGAPIPFLDSAIQCVKDGGMLLVTATDMAVLAGGNTPETCFTKYGSMSVKSKACQELALRIVIHAVQSFANRYGKYVEPILSLKIDFYVRIFFRVVHSPIKCKQVAMQTSMFYQCTGCFSLNFQPLAVSKGPKHFGCPKGPTVGPKCEFCKSSFHLGGPIWAGLIHNKEFVRAMETNLMSQKFEYLGTQRRIEGILSLVLEEVDNPLTYDVPQLASVLKCQTMPIASFRSAVLNLGYKISNSHTGPTLFKTNAPNSALWAIFKEWYRLGHGGKLKEGTPGHNILHNWPENIPLPPVSFEFHPEANPPSKSLKVLRFQLNPTKNWGPGVRNALDANKVVESLEEKRKSESSASSSNEDASEGSNPPVEKKKRKRPRRKKEQKTVEEIDQSTPMDM